jgi:RNA polymerase sigma-70 factor (ECF subfamily)
VAGKVRAALNVVYGSDRIARLLIGLAKKRVGNVIDKLMLINGELGVVTYNNTRAAALFYFKMGESRISALYRIVNPEKLSAVPPLEAETR